MNLTFFSKKKKRKYYYNRKIKIRKKCKYCDVKILFILFNLS